MSYIQVLEITPGEGYTVLEELRNSYGCAPPVWNQLSTTYLGRFWWTGDSGDLWKLVDDARVPVEARALLAFTFDRYYVEHRHYAYMAHCIRKYLKWCPIPEINANHWPIIADILDKAESTAIGLRVTSVSGNPFDGDWDEETEERLPFDWNTAHSLFVKHPELLYSR